ncbi:MAG: hypothetical protein DRP64_16530 [Verrucomicrobia bacterium]|nr:MAG: hypothetical protein DRP64_16530 [Verrucomicrobiota bacterium]
MKKVISMFAILVMIGGLCASCEKDANQPKPEATQQSQESDAKDWEPETSEQSTDDSHDGHDHSGHDH